MNDSATPRTKNALEWTVFGISLVLVLATLGLLVSAAIFTGKGPARLSVRTGESHVDGGRLVIPVTVINKGAEVAENVEVSVTVGEGDARQEASFTLDFVPRDATREGVVSFPADAGKDAPVSRIVGYSKP